MSSLIAKNVQIGADSTATNNFTIYQPATPNGTLLIGNGNTGITSSLVTLTSAGNVGIGTSSPAVNLQIQKAASDTTIRLSDGTHYWDEKHDTATNGLSFSYDGSSKLNLTSSGNLGLGVTPSAWESAYKVVQIGAGGSVAFGSSNAGAGYIGANVYADSAGIERYIASSRLAAKIGINTGAFQWFTAPSGTAGDAITFTQAMTLDASGNLGIGTSSPSMALDVADPASQLHLNVQRTIIPGANSGVGSILLSGGNSSSATANIKYAMLLGVSEVVTAGSEAGALTLSTKAAAGAITERARIDSSGNLLVGKTSPSSTVAGSDLSPTGIVSAVNTDASGLSHCFFANRQGSDGTLFIFRQANTTEGSISVAGTTVSYTGGHLARWAQTTTAKDESLVKGTVLSNLDEMNVYVDADGNPVDNEQLNKVKVSDVEGDANVAGVFVSWTYDEDHNVDEINMAMTGDMIIRIAQGTTVQRGDLLMSAGDGTAKPQGDDIVRSKTVAKVTSTHVTCTYADGSFCVPCVLMAC